MSEEKKTMTNMERNAAEMEIRWQEHLFWQKSQKQLNDSRLKLDSTYRRHVHESNWHNRIFSLAMVFAVTFLAATLARLLGL